MTLTTADHAPDGGAVFERLEPLTGKVASTARAMTVAEATAAVDRAAAAFPEWSRTKPIERRRLLLRAADLLEKRGPDLQRLMTAEVAASGRAITHNMMIGANNLREAASVCTRINGEVIPSNLPGVFTMSIRRPLGVTLGVAPWNGTISLSTRSVAMPLACGNTTVMRGSELSPATHVLMGEVFAEAGFPDGVVNVVVNAPEDGPDIVRALVVHPAVRHVNFTGSSKVGRIVAGLAGEHLKLVLLELGGKNSMIVLRDADLDAAVSAATMGSFLYQGQICMTTGRILVEESIADEFARKLAERTATLRVGDPRLGEVDLTCLIGEDQAVRVKELIDDAVSGGATLLTGGGRDGTFIQPAVLDHVDAGMRIYTEETFGPAACIIRVSGAEEALAIANDTAFGLSGSVFTSDVTLALEMASRWESGNVHINGSTFAVESHVPYGGVKDSGYGRFGGSGPINEFTYLQTVTINHDQHFAL